MNTPVTTSLSEKLLRVVLLAGTLALLGIAVLVVGYEATTFRSRATAQLQNDAELLEATLQTALQFQDPRTAQARLRILAEPDLGVVYDREGQMFAEHHRNNNLLPAPPRPEPDGIQVIGNELVLWRTLYENQTVLGHLYLLEKLPPLHARLRQHLILFGSVALALVVMALAVRWGLQRYALKPLAELVTTTRLVTQRGDYSVRSTVPRDDEFGQLARALNHMLELIGERETALRTATARIREVFSAATEVAIVATDLQGGITLFNPGAEQMFGYRAGEVVGRESVVKLHDPAELANFEAELLTRYGKELRGIEALVSLSTRGQAQARAFTFVRKDGSQLRGHLVVTPVRDELGQTHGYLGIVTDITERQKAEDALRESELRFRSVVEHAHAIIFILDRNGVFRLSAGRGLAKIGLRPGQVVGVSAFELYAGVPSVTTAIERALAGAQVQITNRVSDRVFDTVYSPYYSPTGELHGVVGIAIDITERTKAEESLRMFRYAIEQSPDAAFWMNRDAGFTYVNDQCCRSLGYTREELLQLRLWDIDPEFPKHLWYERWELYQADRRGGAEHLESVHRRKDGSTFPVEVMANHLWLDDDEIHVAFARDITERKRAETALRESEARLQSILAATADGILAVDSQGRVILANRRFAEMWHMPPALLETHDDRQFLDFAVGQLEDPEAFRQKVQSIYDSGDQATELIRLKGGKCFERYSAPLLLGSAGIGRVWSFRDVTDQKRAEEELQRREQRFRSLIENGSDMITVLNRDGIIRFQSPSSERILGFTAAQMNGHNILDFVHPEDQSQTRETLRQSPDRPAESVTLQVRLQHKNGSWRRIEMRGRTAPEASAEGDFIVNARDITDALKLEEQLRQAQKMEAVGQLSGGVAHDFNNLLTVILGHVSLLQTNDQLPPPLQESIGEISQSAERAANLTRQLLAFSRRHTMQPKAIDLNETVANMTKMLRRVLGEDITMQLHYAPHPGVVHADAGMMEQVLLNLVVNARDAMPQGGTLTIETAHVDLDETAASRIPQARPGAFVRLTVADRGCGIAPEIMPHIFEPFFTTKDVGKGSGLGLATVYGIVQHHDGWITAHSEVGHGATFHIYLPQLTQVAESRTSETSFTAMPRGTETILLVEDEPALRMLARKVLTRLGYRTLEAASGVGALDIWQQHRQEVQLLLTDMVMPDGMTGRELAQRLQSDKPQLKIIYTSGYSPDIAGRDFPLQDGVNFLPKPFGPLKLAQIVRASLDA